MVPSGEHSMHSGEINMNCIVEKQSNSGLTTLHPDDFIFIAETTGKQIGALVSDYVVQWN